MEMAPAPVSSNPRTVEGIFKDFSARRSALVRALTSDVDEFYGFCDPDKENLCLYGHANGSWEVALPAEEVPPELPEPALGINFARDGMNRRDWLSLVAVHSDSWLISVAFFFSARLNANERNLYIAEGRCLRPGSRSCTFTGRYSVECRPKKHIVVPKLPRDQMLQRLYRKGGVQHKVNKNIAKGIFDACSCWRALQWKRLFNMINDLPTVYEALVDRKHGRDRSGIDSSGKSRHSSKRTNENQAKNSRAVAEEYDEDDEEHNETFCGTCGGRYSANEFWIGCDICERWFHGKCVRITPAKAEHIKQYKCPDCSAKKIRQ